MEGEALRPAGSYRAIAGEGPIWHDGAVWYVDIRAPAVIRYEPETGTDTVFPAPEPVAALAPLPNGVLVAGRTALWALRNGAFDLHTSTPFVPDTHRFNDGCTDDADRFLVGTMSLGGGEATGDLWSFGDGEPKLLMSGFRTINGLAVSTDGAWLLLSDSHPDVAKVWRCPYNTASGSAGPPKPFARLPEGRPDGACFDDAGGYWIAATGAGCLLRYDPTGTITDRIACGTPRVSKPCLGGPDGRDLYVTTISLEHEDDPRAGRLLRGRLT